MPKLHNLADRLSKEVLGDREIAADFLLNYLSPHMAALLDFATLEIVKDSFVDSELKEFFSDLLYKVRLSGNQEALVYVLLEHKSAPDEWVAFQLLRYMIKIWEPLANQAGKKLPPIIPLVLYHGTRKWNVPKTFLSLVELNEAETLVDSIPDFRYELCDLAEYETSELRGNPKLKLAMAALQNARKPGQPQIFPAFVEMAADLNLKNPGELQYFLTVLTYYVGAAKSLAPEDIGNAIRKAFPKQEKEIMSSALRHFQKEGLEKGIRIGIEKGKTEGRLKGLQEGMKEGIKEGRKKAEQEARQQALELAVRQLTKKLGSVPATARKRIQLLSSEELRELSVALLDFNSQKDLRQWLAGKD